MTTITKYQTFLTNLFFSVFTLLLIVSSDARAIQMASNDDFDKVNVIPTDTPFPEASFLTTQKGKNHFPLIMKGTPATILVSSSDHAGVLKIAGLFQKDLSHVSGQAAELTIGDELTSKNAVIVGTVGKSTLIDQLIANGKIDISDLKGKWEQFLILPVKQPMEGVDNALVIVGSDKRGTIFGMFELSESMGVSPWYWWADAPIQSRENVYVKTGVHTTGEPKVKYRGIFLNDEDPALSGWARERFGGINHDFYEKVFELILRMKGNYLWPAMWGKSLWDDDSLSAPLANEMGIVLSTSHHEPLMRAHVEWNRYGEGAWNYDANPENLQKFWRDGMVRTQGQEKVVTLAMRGDGDEAMGEGTNIELLEKIVNDQRKIIAEVTGKPAEETPQVWALYKEVQEYYDKGMRVPDDVTLLLCDDNWGQVRVLPALDAKPRKGGYGMYYHFDFVGGPRSYKWLNTVQIEHVWEQMRLTYEYGVDEIWLVNVGDLKPMDLPINFFLDYAWDPTAIKANDLPGYYTQWADAQFGGQYAKEIGEILARYTKYNARRKPELLAHDTYSLTNFREAETVVEDYNELLIKAQRIKAKLPKEAQDAFYQLVLYPVEACANMNEMYVAAAKNKLYRTQNRASTNYYADHTKALFFKDADLLQQHNEFANGKWNHIMEQTHMGHVSWFDPKVNKMPEVSYIQVPTRAGLGYVLEYGEGSSGRNARGVNSHSFSTFDPLNDQRYYLEVFNTGAKNLNYKLEAKNDWIKLSSTEGSVQYEEKIFVSVDWEKVPAGQTEGEILLSSTSSQSFTIKVPLRINMPNKASGFVENRGIVSMEATSFQRKKEVKGISWELIPNLGRTGSAVTTLPVTASTKEPGKNTPYLEYQIVLLDSGTFDLQTWFSPTLNFQKDEGLIYAISIDGGKLQVMNLHENAKAADWTYPDWWNNAVTDNLMKQSVMQQKLSAGQHTLKYYMLDPGMVLEKITLYKKGVDTASYLGAPESVKK
ncbi:glycosyl hydrolase 115 family protein [Gilvimarinus agarilyticus]|uniref:Glycosyl hydrolase family 115 n=1 Tax=Reichenbachiella agariperforans TaxID=156994 RepID=A0A1M6K5H3_REIAG|nr:glycosyl hydrolase 115 family protein [Reichenbachiella agariperforans]MBU2887978.1 glycosyl hydrolase 115 family protein [Gilvimarinus agarilyticus]MBU2913426.1 glycosyl hydrolase 115 family protein [Reichenbachiella agariperforans]SHJ54226.1 Glycosyl hydrolase family 115 [Reichenbachiella agariperforans]